MTNKNIIQKFTKLAEKFRTYENDCYKEMNFLTQHNYNLECEAVRYKQKAYNQCWLELMNLIDHINE